jgi:hypothetical protein
VVVDATGEVYGDAPNTARMQALAEPGAVLMTAQVQRQVAGLFVVEERGCVRQLTPFVGREEEMAMPMRRWERPRQGEGQLVLIVGEPGLGKSRLIEEFHGRLRDTPHT